MVLFFFTLLEDILKTVFSVKIPKSVILINLSVQIIAYFLLGLETNQQGYELSTFLLGSKGTRFKWSQHIHV